ncbi:tannase/feruloyl esterase family alpha/beta hydrolase [Roseimicrobium sp. ORNL1]|uniref:tannase/feruloyl esterase family alpha/beta hydrolase n=1 Tax=Roseimicrobium sp. ORNL1 TaxID=2711231 RepID=UPI00197F1191|nr:tannase/feruloyl esterase family alpha/beta hydrolase [Roseimicrobium sp. ORNL1]
MKPHSLLLTSFSVLLCGTVAMPILAKEGTKAPPKAQAVSPAEEGAARLRSLQIESGKIVFVGHIAAGEQPARIVVNLLLQPAKGSNIKVEAWLPDGDKWNGRFIGLGNGGSAGKINPDSLAGPLSQGFAVATTDMGTAPNSDSGIGNREVWKDFGYRATHLMTVAAKDLIKAYYGKAPEYSYFNGGSTGGQQALQEAQRYPEDYDGIVANVPAHCRTPLHAYFLWNDQILRACPFTEKQEKAVIAAGNEYMASRELPQTAGKMVSDPRCTAQDIEAVIALARTKDATLTDQHADAMRKLFSGPKHAVTGERIFCGIPFGADFKSAHGHLYLFQWVFGKEKDLTTIDFGKDIDTYTAELAPYLNAENADLSAFEARGGKILMITGSADSVVPYHATLDYYERVVEHFGSVEKAQSFARLYFVPGMAHGPGPGINKLPSMLKLVMDWREKNAAPGKIQAQRIVDGRTAIEIPLYPYPAKAAVDAATGGKGFVEVAGPRGGVERVAERFRGKAAE